MTFLWLLLDKQMTDNNEELQSVSDGVSFSLEDGDTSDSASQSTTPCEVMQYVGAEGGDDISLCSRVSNGNDSSCDSLADTEDICPR